MIALLTGRLAAKSPGNVIVDVGGVGYQAHIPLSSSYDLPEIGGTVTLHIHTHVREDAISLFGFPTLREKELFLALMGVSGVGPKLALNIISGLACDRLVEAISGGDERTISTVPGVGKKTAARLVLELRDKVSAFGLEAPAGGPCKAGPAADRQRSEAISALVNLGYHKSHAEDAVKKSCGALGDNAPIEAVIREALKALAKSP